jgi:cobalamin biosynthesis protein CobD/CbiB
MLRNDRHSAKAGRPLREDIAQALTLVRRSMLLWLALLVCWGLARA